MLSSRNDLSLATIAYYGPALPLALFVAFRHGFGRQLGWIYLSILAVVRIAGSGIELGTIDSPSKGLTETAIIFESIGLSPLLLAMLGIEKRIYAGIKYQRTVPQRLFDVLHLPTLVALIMAIIGGRQTFAKKPNVQKHGHTLSKIAIVIFIIVLVIQTAIAGISLRFLPAVIRGEKRLVFALIFSCPFLLVRLIYSVLTAFDYKSQTFNLASQTTEAVVVQGCMAIAMEFLIVGVYLLAGFITPVIPRDQVRGKNGDMNEQLPTTSMAEGGMQAYQQSKAE